MIEEEKSEFILKTKLISKVAAIRFYEKFISLVQDDLQRKFNEWHEVNTLKYRLEHSEEE